MSSMIDAVRPVPSNSQFPFDDSVLSWVELHNSSATPPYLLANADEFQKQMGYEAISWSDDDLDPAADIFVRLDRPENPIDRVGKCSVQQVLELCVTEDWEEVRN